MRLPVILSAAEDPASVQGQKKERKKERKKDSSANPCLRMTALWGASTERWLDHTAYQASVLLLLLLLLLGGLLRALFDGGRLGRARLILV